MERTRSVTASSWVMARTISWAFRSCQRASDESIAS